MKLVKNIGVMQGRLSPKIGNKIQFFPEKHWTKEFKKAKKVGLNFIEWTLDYKNLYLNPMFSKSGVKKINYLKKINKIKIKTLTGDCFMQKPFWKIKKNYNLIIDLINIIKACSKLKINYIVIPLVDKGSIKNKFQEKKLISILRREITPLLKLLKVGILFESDYKPKQLKRFISKFDTKYFGINYDSGNSSSLGYDVDEEFNAYGKLIRNIHLKDRVYNGNTVRLGYGDTNFEKLFLNIKKMKYKKLLILQTARSKNKNDLEEINLNLNYIKEISAFN